MNRGIIIQQSDSGQSDLLDLTEGVHRRYCRQWGFDYWVLRGNLELSRGPFWNKETLALMASLSLAYDLIIWLDADSVIINHHVDLHGVPLGESALGVTTTRRNGENHLAPYMLLGVFYARSGEKLEKLLHDLRGYSNHWNEEEALNAMIRARDQPGDLIAALPPEWHAHHTLHPVAGAHVVGYHCSGSTSNRLFLMKNILNEHDLL